MISNLHGVEVSNPASFRLMMEASATFTDMEEVGWKVDVEYFREKADSIKARIAKLDDELKKDPICKLWRKQYGEKTKITSRDQLGNIIFGVMGIPSVKATATGRYATDEAAFQDIDLPFVQAWNEIDKLRRVLSTNIHGIMKHTCDGVLRPFFNLHTVESYRSSSSKPNSQNIPARDPEISSIVRRGLIPSDPDCVLVESDFGRIEVCSSACYHYDPMMIKYIEDPTRDMHRDMAAQLFVVPDTKVSKAMRGEAKAKFVFAEFYGDWYKTVGKNLWGVINREKIKTKDGVLVTDHLKSVGITHLGDLEAKSRDAQPGSFLDHVKDVESDFWNDRFSVYNKWKKDFWQEYLKTGWFRFKTGFVGRGIYEKNQLINAPIQGTAFHWLLSTIIELNKWLKRSGMRSRLIGQIHDSLILNVHRSELQDVLHKIQWLVTVYLRKLYPWIIVPLVTEHSVCESNWFEKREWVDVGGVWKPKLDD